MAEAIGRDRDGGFIDLSGCAREPIHTPGSIQPHGALLVLDERDLTVLQASGNLAGELGVSPEDALGRSLTRVLGHDLAHQLAGDIDRSGLFLGGRATSLRRVPLGGGFDAVAHRADAGVVLEFERAVPEGTGGSPLRSSPSGGAPLVEAFERRAGSARSLADLCGAACEEVRRLSGFDRVLVYRFDRDWHGNVIGEEGSGRLPSYLHHWFPASDIPAQARELYRVNRVRLIPDADYRPVPVVPAISPATGRCLDMSFSVLRSVSPVHVEYMRNMRTAASMSVSILQDGRLWGLISCHHREPKRVSFSVRATCDRLAQTLSGRAAAIEEEADRERRRGSRAAFSVLSEAIRGRGDLAALAERPRDVLAAVSAQGAAILTGGGCLLLGVTPSEPQVRQVADWLARTIRLDVSATDSLPGVYAEARDFKDIASGLLAVTAPGPDPGVVMWFRPEAVRVVTWGGDPSKPAETSGRDGRLHPRRSFKTWKETVRDRSLAWRPDELESAAEFGRVVAESASRE
jgi:light-regulated signal transduction histidine kinase (bacteriophytochrome)